MTLKAAARRIWNSLQPGELFRLFFDNPVLLRQVRSGQRTRSFGIWLLIFVALSSFIMWFPHLTYMLEGKSWANASKGLSDGAIWAFYALIVAIGILISLSAISAGTLAVSSERERQTFDHLRLASLSGMGFLLGRVLGTLSLLGIYILATLPAMGLVLLTGGMSAQQVLRALLGLVLLVLVLNSMGLLLGCPLKKKNSAQRASGAISVLVIFSCYVLSAGVLSHHRSPVALPVVALSPILLFFPIDHVVFCNMWRVPLAPVVLLFSLIMSFWMIRVASRRVFENYWNGISAGQAAFAFYFLLLVILSSLKASGEAFVVFNGFIFFAMVLYCCDLIRQQRITDADDGVSDSELSIQNPSILFLHVITGCVLVYFYFFWESMVFDLVRPLLIIPPIIFALLACWLLARLATRCVNHRARAFWLAVGLIFILLFVPPFTGGALLSHHGVYEEDSIFDVPGYAKWLLPLKTSPVFVILSQAPWIYNPDEMVFWDRLNAWLPSWVVSAVFHAMVSLGVLALTPWVDNRFQLSRRRKQAQEEQRELPAAAVLEARQ
jgi:hypothetical protein